MPILSDEALFGAAAALIKPAMPKGWMALGALSLNRALDGREPLEMWTLRVQWATDIKGGPPVYYGGEVGTRKTGRRLEVTIEAPTVDALVEALRLLPASGLEKMAALDWPIEFVIDSVIVP